MKKLLTGNEAIARGAFEAGVRYASAYPGTPSTEILENIAQYKGDILAEWAPNEKVALESSIGASIAGARAIASMKHVGVNVAADPLFTFAYTGVNGGMVLISADEPGQHSSQNEQDNRNYAKFAKIPMLEPSDSMEAKEMVIKAFDLSEKFDTPVLVRVTTRICHSKSIVSLSNRKEIEIKKYDKNVKKYMTVPSFARNMRVKVEERMEKLKLYTEKTKLNYIEDNNSNIGIITSGACYRFAKEVFGANASYLKLGFTNPLPTQKIKQFAQLVDTIYIIEENDPIIEEKVKSLGVSCHGKDVFPAFGEMTSDVIREVVCKKTLPHVEAEIEALSRQPALCSGCPHRGFFYEVGKRKDVIVSGDIGCYTLGFAPPYNAMDFNICMGASISAGHGLQQVLDMKFAEKRRVISVLGDSTFFHTGINSLLHVAYNKSKTINVILDNRITGMTGHQENPGTGYTIQGESTPVIDIEALVKACGIKNIVTIDPNDLSAVKKSLEWAMALDEASVIITRWPCVLKKFSTEDKAEFLQAFKSKCKVKTNKCIGCKVCVKTGCASIGINTSDKKAEINKNSCVGCTVCKQVCPVNAIVEVKNYE